MNKLITILTIFLAASVVSFESCKKSTVAVPTITLEGANPISWNLNSATYTEPGYTASGPVMINTSAVNINLKGYYTITYTVSNGAGSTATAERGVNVVNDADFISGVYQARDSSADNGTVIAFTATFTTSNTVDNSFSINNFGNFGSAINVPCIYQSLGGVIDLIGSPSLGSGQTLGASTGSITSLSSPVTIVIQYYYTSGANTYHHYATYTK